MNNKKIICCLFFGLLIPMQNFSMFEKMRIKIDQGLTRVAEVLDSLIFPGSEEFDTERERLESKHAVVVIPTELEDIETLVMFVVAGFFVTRVIEERVFPAPSFTRNISSIERLAEEAAERSEDERARKKFINIRPPTPPIPKFESNESIATTQNVDEIVNSGLFHNISSETMIDRLNSPSPTPKNDRQSDSWIFISDVGGNDKIN
ncbi:hypothetical protein KBB68_02770 [Candidatus Babeliales bacterium]|nr:hypothetical protein [Candidatus Babeliales bacterium]